MAKKKKKPGEFLFDGNAWEDSETVNSMEDKLQIIYLRLIIKMRKNTDGGIQANDKEVCNLVRCNIEQFEEIKFKALYEKDGRYYQSRAKNDHDEALKEFERKGKKKMPESEIQLQKECLMIYYEFYERQTGQDNPKLDVVQMVALREMIKRFRQAKHGNTDIQIIQAFQLIFNNWELYPINLQKFIKLNQVNSNLPTFLVTIKQHNQKRSGESNIQKRLHQSQNLRQMIEQKHSVQK